MAPVSQVHGCRALLPLRQLRRRRICQGAEAPFRHTGKYGIPYDDIVALSDADVADVLDHIRLRNPQRPYRQWQPTDAEGDQVRTGRGPATLGPIDWMVFMDVDEFLVSDQTGSPRWPRAGGGRVNDAQRGNDSRFDHLDRYVTETTSTFRNPPPAAPKWQNVVCHGAPLHIARKTVRVQRAGGSSCTTSSRAPITQRDHFEESGQRNTRPNPSYASGRSSTATELAGSASERNEWRPPTNA